MEDVNINELHYAPWLENALKELVHFPVKGICMFAITENGEVYSNYSDDISMVDKVTIAGLIQQDATIDVLVANKMVKDPEEDEETT